MSFKYRVPALGFKTAPRAVLFDWDNTLLDQDAARSDGVQRFHIGKTHYKHVAAHAEPNDPLGGIVFLEDLGQLATIVNDLIGPRVSTERFSYRS